jgi:hypothetical protein
MPRALLALAVVSTGLVPAQGVFQGNGVPSAFLAHTPGVLGRQLALEFGSPTAAVPVAILGIADGIGPVTHPLLGTLGLDVFRPSFQALVFGLDPAGNGGAVLPLPPGYAQAFDPPLFAQAATFEPGGLSLSKTVRIEWANPDAWEPVADLGAVRQLHTATALGEGPRDNTTEVLICGGTIGSFILVTAMASAELYSPLLRATTPLPPLSVPRAGHRAVRLSDGRVLIAGGVTTGGTVTATCELFDPATRTFAPGPTMTTPRASHAMTLLDDGRVLVSGGVADWRDAGPRFIDVLNSAQGTAEVLDAGATAWTQVPGMASQRMGHSQTRLLDGRVLVVSGIRGGYAGALSSTGAGTDAQIPLYTPSCEVFDPATSMFAATSNLVHVEPLLPFPIGQTYTGRAFHGSSLLPGGDVLITGGFVAQPTNVTTQDESIAVTYCHVWSAATGTWSSTAPLPVAAAMHAQVPHGNGALVCGGFTTPLASLATTAQTVFHDGTAVVALASLGIDGGGPPRGRGAHTLTALHDGTFLVHGGGVWPHTAGDGWVYTPW